jgi:protein-S-isoprenylcysteine O-methyltransferase Ste14
MAVTALLIYLVGLAVIFGLRTWLQVRRTGSSGFHGISGERGSLRWWAGVSFIAALVLAATGVASRPSGSAADTAGGVGLVLALVGFAGVLAAQTGMGSSWRIGVKQTERTELVTSGFFAVVRNPIFSAMVVAQLGLTLMVPTWVSATALICLVVAIEAQVRLIEEPYLLATHGTAYRRYASATGRFFPGVGRLKATDGQEVR